MNGFHPELARVARWLPDWSLGPAAVSALRWLTPRQRPPRTPPGVTGRLVEIPGPAGPIVARVFAPAEARAPTPALLWFHGGGYIIGDPSQEDRVTLAFAERLGITVVAPTYRLGPEHPHPAAVEDAYAALAWLHRHAASLGVRQDRLAIGGRSAGGGLAASLALYTRDHGEVRPVFAVLVYPMLDDRTATREVDGRRLRVWSQRSNTYGWTSYLGRPPGGGDVPIYAAPARATDLRGLPPTWIGVGTHDLFHDEDVDYPPAGGGRCAVRADDRAGRVPRLRCAPAGRGRVARVLRRPGGRARRSAERAVEQTASGARACARMRTHVRSCPEVTLYLTQRRHWSCTEPQRR
jgi:acetyl esterase/lipase